MDCEQEVSKTMDILWHLERGHTVSPFIPGVPHSPLSPWVQKICTNSSRLYHSK